MAKKIYITVLGCGFAGLACISRLRALLKGAADITAIDQSMFHTYIPGVHGVLKDRSKERSIRIPLEKYFESRKVKFINSKVESIDYKKKKIFIEGKNISYDFLVNCLGSIGSMKSVKEAVYLRNKIVQAFEEVGDISDYTKQLTFSVIGGGLTGVEVANEINELCTKLCEDHFVMRRNVTVRLVHKGNGLVPELGKRASELISQHMRKQGIKLITNSEAIVKKGGIEIGGKLLDSRVTVVSGVTPTGKGLVVNKYLQSSSDKHTFGAGDVVNFINPKTGKHITKTAQNAIEQGRTAASNIFNIIVGRKLQEYYPSEKIMLVSLGKSCLLSYKNFNMKSTLFLFMKKLIEKYYMWKSYY